MSTTHNYLTKRLGVLRTDAAATSNEIGRLQTKHAAQLNELDELAAALTAIEKLWDEVDQDDGGAGLAEALDAVPDEPTAEEAERG